MSEHALAQTHPIIAPQAVVKDSVLLQRREREQAEQSALQQWRINTVSGTFAEPRVGYDFSRVPAFNGMVRQNLPKLRTQPMVQRSPKDGAAAGSSSCPTCPEVESEQISAIAEPTAEAVASALESDPTPVSSEPTEETSEETATNGEVALPGLFIEDSITELSAGQMKKSEFLNQLRAEVCLTIEAALVGTGRTTEDCPYLNYWFDFYGQKNSTHIERVIHRYAPNASNVTAATGYISVITQRARQAAETWARTGEITGVPEGIPLGLPGMGLFGGLGTLISGIGSIFFKSRDGGARGADGPRAIQRELGEGRPLNGGVRSRMESAFGINFAHVRTHTDSKASELSNRFNARAFTVGEHVAFGSGEYRPGTLIGDALIAHEMAHVVQQGGASTTVAPMDVDNSSYNVLEADADKAAMGAITTLWGKIKGEQKGVAREVIPRLRSGLRLQRCATPTTTSVATITSETVETTPGTRTRTDIGVGEEVNLTHSAGSVTWATTAGTLSATAGATVRLTAPNTAQTVTVTAGGATKAFTVIAPTGIHMDRFPGTGIRHTQHLPDSGIQTRPFLLPDRVNFSNVQYHEVDVPATASGHWTCQIGDGHDAHPATLTLSSTVVAGKGTRANVRDTAYSGHCGGAAPLTSGHKTWAIPNEYKVGSGSFHQFVTVTQVHTLAADVSTCTTDKAGAHGDTTVATATSTY